MKIEPRGKYAGVKVHLDKEECEVLLNFFADTVKAGGVEGIKAMHPPNYFNLTLKIAKKIQNLLLEKPDLLNDRSEEEVNATLMKEFTESQEKIKALNHGLDWKKVKVVVEK